MRGDGETVGTVGESLVIAFQGDPGGIASVLRHWRESPETAALGRVLSVKDRVEHYGPFTLSIEFIIGVATGFVGSPVKKLNAESRGVALAFCDGEFQRPQNGKRGAGWTVPLNRALQTPFIEHRSKII